MDRTTVQSDKASDKVAIFYVVLGLFQIIRGTSFGGYCSEIKKRLDIPEFNIIAEDIYILPLFQSITNIWIAPIFLI